MLSGNVRAQISGTEFEVAQGRPTFYRSGESIEQSAPLPPAANQPPFTEPESPFDVLEEEPPLPPVEPEPQEFAEPAASPEGFPEPAFVPEEFVEPEPVPEEFAPPVEVVEQEPIEEPQRKPSASRGSLTLKLLSRVKYIAGAILLLVVAFVFFFKKKGKKAVTPAAVAATTEGGEVVVPTPENAQHVEESSARLEHALEAMGESDTPSPPQEEDGAVGFSDPEPPKS